MTDNELEQLLAPQSVRSLDEWQALKDFLAKSFAKHLGEPIEPVWEQAYDEIRPKWGFAFGIRSGRPPTGPLGLEWYGVISHSCSQGDTQALVLLFSHDRRMVPIDGHEYLFYEFLPNPAGGWHWVNQGWTRSEFDEWESYRQLSEVVTRKFCE